MESGSADLVSCEVSSGDNSFEEQLQVADSNLEVLVRGLTGHVILGPERVMLTMTISEIKSRLLETSDPWKPQAVTILAAGQDCSAGATLAAFTGEEDNVVELIAVFSELFITRRQRVEFLKRVEAARPRRGRVPADILLEFPAAARADCGFVQQVVSESGLALEHAHISLRADRTIVSAALGNSGLAWRYADPALQTDRRLALKAIRQGWSGDVGVSELGPFEFFGDDFKRDPEIALAACVRHPDNLQYAASCLRGDDQFIIRVISHDNRYEALALKHASDHLIDASAFMLTAIRANIFAFSYARQSQIIDKEFILAAVAVNGRLLGHVPENWLGDQDVLRAAFRKGTTTVDESPFPPFPPSNPGWRSTWKDVIIHVLEVLGGVPDAQDDLAYVLAILEDNYMIGAPSWTIAEPDIAHAVFTARVRQM